MAERSTVEKLLTVEMLEGGFIGLTKSEVERLGLPNHSTTIDCRHADDHFAVQWRRVERELRGEALAELLQLEAAPGWMARLHPAGDGIELDLGEPGSSRLLNRPLFDPVPRRAQQRITADPSRTERRRGVRQRSVRQERLRLKSAEEFDWIGRVGIHRRSIEQLLEHMSKHAWDDEAFFGLRLEGERLAAVNDFDELLAVDLAHIESMPHQEAAAAKVLSAMGGRAVLADEVGLGKTIEAGLITKELILRGFVNRVLVLCPATLREQWQQELLEKFDEKFEIVSRGSESFERDRLIMSTQLATMNADRLVSQPWDLVIVDEAHKRLRGRATQKLYRALEPRYLLFLTATPVQNSLEELYLLVETLRPGTFLSRTDFRSRFMGSDPRTPKNPAELRQLVSQVMVRTTRSQAGLNETSRFPTDHGITLGPVERKVYELITTTLRDLMTSRDDHLRRRHLAHRLTLSPRALALTAARIASNHPDHRVRDALEKLSELCLEMGMPSRQAKLLEVVREWVHDPGKGKVLVFTQHSDTLEDLMRVLGQAGIEAVPFHGGLSAAAKRAAIASFRDSARVMVSTDAGAEGLNLQFANCVVNYDLPWNPMRIEQRIGRVHRLTQTRDVYVANLFARDTIDERVYRLLHDKLRMFELLFGQVTTVLGELEIEGEGASFEEQILRAYLSPDDESMARRLDDLGAKVDRAYESAREMITADSHLSRWLHSPAHRAEIPEGGARELMPTIRERTRQRQSEVLAFVERFMAMIGAKILVEQRDHDDRPLFLSAEVSPHARADFDGREHLHLAFSGEGLGIHPEAELCAVGSEVFEEMVVALREHGDLLITVPDADPGQEPWLVHDADLELIARRVRGPKAWTGNAWWRVRIDAGETTDHLISTPIGQPADPVENRRALQDGEAPPATFDVSQTIDLLRSHASESFSEVLAQEAARAGERHREETMRLRQHYSHLIVERERELERASSADRRRELADELAQLKSTRNRVTESGPVESSLYAELLAVELHGSAVVKIEEDWRHVDGRSFTITTEWDTASSLSPDYYDELDQRIDQLGICAEGHPGDAARFRRCPTCERDACAACEARRQVFADCIICGVASCGDCIDPNTPICVRCSDPERAPDLDRDLQLAWKAGHDTLLLVGFRTIDIVRPNGELLRHVDGHGAPTDAFEGTIAALAAADLPLDGSVRMVDWISEPTPPADAIDVAWTRSHRTEQSIAPPSQIDQRVADYLPPGPWPLGVEEAPPALAALARSLRPIDPAPAPTILVEPTSAATWIEVDSNGIRFVESHSRAGREPETREQHVQLFPDLGSFPPTSARAEVQGREILVRRCNESFVVQVRGHSGTDEVFVPGHDHALYPVERALEALSSSHGLRGGTTVRVLRGDLAEVRFAIPNGAELVSRDVDRDLILAWGVADRADPVDAEVAAAVGLAIEDTERIRRVEGLAGRLNELLPPGDHALLRPRYRITETWTSESLAQVTYEHTGAGLALPPLVDGSRDEDFTVDSNAHLVSATATWTCRSCRRRLCTGCGDDGALGVCHGCGEVACGGCRAASHPDVQPAVCECCATTSCTECGFDAGIETCPVCQGLTCTSCLGEVACHTCEAASKGDPLSPDELPARLRWSGLRVTGARDGRKMVATAAGALRRELVVVRDEQVSTWWTVGSAGTAQIRLIVGTHLGTGNVAVSFEASPPAATPKGMVISDVRTLQLRLRSTIDGETQHFDLADATEPGSILDEAVRLVGGTDEVGPEVPPQEIRARVDRLVAPVLGEPDGELVLSQEQGLQRFSLAPDGLLIETGPASAPKVEVVPWTAPEAGFPAVLSACRPRPQLLQQAVSGDVAVGLGRVGSTPIAVVVSHDGVTIHPLDDVPQFAESALIGELLELGSSARIVQFVDPAGLTLVDVSRAELQHRSIRAVPVEVDVTGPHDFVTAALSAWGAPPINLPGVAPMADSQLRETLRRRVEGDLPPSPWVQIDAEITDTWNTRYGRTELQYVVPAGSTAGRVMTSDTGQLCATVHVDRSGHIVERSDECTYCRQETCVACGDPVRPCELCSIPICGICSPSREHLCPACSSLAAPGRLRRLLRPRSDPTLVARDVVHEVEVWVSDGSVEVISSHLPGQRRPVVLSRGLIEHINARAGRALLS